MGELQWRPLDGEERDGTIAASIGGTISLIFVSAILVYVARFFRQNARLSTAERLQFESQAARFLTSDFGCLFINLMVGDLIQAVGFTMGWHWVRLGKQPSPTSPGSYGVCIAQGVMLQVGVSWVYCAIFIVTSHLFCVLVLSYRPPHKALVGSVVISWCCVGFMALYGPFRMAVKEQPYYTTTGGWCWINLQRKDARFYFGILWNYVVIAFCIVVYGIIAARMLYYQRKLATAGPLKPDAKLSRRTAMMMLLFPALYVVTLAPLTSWRIASNLNHVWPRSVHLAAGTMNSLLGAANAVMYATTRNFAGSSKQPKLPTFFVGRKSGLEDVQSDPQIAPPDFVSTRNVTPRSTFLPSMVTIELSRPQTTGGTSEQTLTMHEERKASSGEQR
ncbi:hypothetical protein T439DRAFT_325898 [Meredithblackwellia eburnea MCA 4105]